MKTVFTVKRQKCEETEVPFVTLVFTQVVACIKQKEKILVSMCPVS